MVRLSIEGREVAAPAGCSILQAYVHAGETLVEGVGCMGQGVCGSCRVMVRRSGEQEVRTALACETLVEDGMQVAFIDYFTTRRPPRLSDRGHRRQLAGAAHHLRDLPRSLALPPLQRLRPRLPEGTSRCSAASTWPSRASWPRPAHVFDECVMCNLCTLACPEYIRPNHLGLFVRRIMAALTLRPANLMRRLQQIDSGEMKVDIDAPGARPPPDRRRQIMPAGIPYEDARALPRRRNARGAQRRRRPSPNCSRAIIRTTGPTRTCTARRRRTAATPCQPDLPASCKPTR